MISEEGEAVFRPEFGGKCVSFVHKPQRDPNEHTNADCAAVAGEPTRLLGLYRPSRERKLALCGILFLFRAHGGRRSLLQLHPGVLGFTESLPRAIPMTRFPRSLVIVGGGEIQY